MPMDFRRKASLDARAATPSAWHGRGRRPPRDGQAPAQAASERGPDGRKLSAKQKLSKRGKPESEEPPKAEAAKTDAGKDEPAKGEP